MGVVLSIQSVHLQTKVSSFNLCLEASFDILTIFWISFIAAFVIMLVTHSLTNCRLVNLIDVTLACEVAYSKLVKVVMVAYVSDGDRVGNSLLQIWKLRFGHKA